MTTTTATYPKTETEAYEMARAGRLFLETFTGRHKVVGFRPNQDCNVVTNNTGSTYDQQGWAAGWWQCEIADN
jgi:hypothetical protein